MEQKQRRHGSSKAYANPKQKIQTLIDETDRKVKSIRSIHDPIATRRTERERAEANLIQIM